MCAPTKPYLSDGSCQASSSRLGSPSEPRVRWLEGIEAFEFDARISGGEVPADCRLRLIAPVLPLLGLLTELLHGRDVACQALAHQHAQFNLGDIQPTGVLGRVMNLQLDGQSFGLFGGKIS